MDIGAWKWTARIISFFPIMVFTFIFIWEGITFFISNGVSPGLIPLFPIIALCIAGCITGCFAALAGGILLIAGGTAISAYFIIFTEYGRLGMTLSLGLPLLTSGVLYLLIHHQSVTLPVRTVDTK